MARIDNSEELKKAKSEGDEEDYKFFTINLDDIKKKNNNIKVKNVVNPICGYCGENFNSDFNNYKCKYCDKNTKKASNNDKSKEFYVNNKKLLRSNKEKKDDFTLNKIYIPQPYLKRNKQENEDCSKCSYCKFL